MTNCFYPNSKLCMDNNNNKILSYDDDGYDELTMRGVVKNSTVTNKFFFHNVTHGSACCLLLVIH